MTICPIAIAASCEKCPIVKVCPAKSIIGDYTNNEPEIDKDEAGKEK